MIRIAERHRSRGSGQCCALPGVRACPAHGQRARTSPSPVQVVAIVVLAACWALRRVVLPPRIRLHDGDRLGCGAAATGLEMTSTPATLRVRIHRGLGQARHAPPDSRLRRSVRARAIDGLLPPLRRRRGVVAQPMSDEPDPPTAPSRVTVRDVLAIIGMIFQAAFVLTMSMKVAGGGHPIREGSTLQVAARCGAGDRCAPDDATLLRLRSPGRP